MSLFRQLVGGAWLLLLALWSAGMVWDWNASHAAWEQRWQMRVQLAAGALTDWMVQPGHVRAAAPAEVLAAVFDSSDFSEMRWEAADGQLLFAREQDAAHPLTMGIPGWLLPLLPLQQVQTQQVLEVEGQALGTLHITANSRPVQLRWWHASVRLTWLVLLTGLLWTWLCGMVLQKFFHQQSQAIADGIAQIGRKPGGKLGNQSGAEHGLALSTAMPAFPEESVQAGVQHAILHAQQRVQQTVQAQSQRIEFLEQENHSDSITGLPNGKCFIQALEKTLPPAPQSRSTMVLLCRLCDLQRMNSHMQRSRVDNWLIASVRHMRQLLTEYPGVQGQWFRINGSDFALLLQTNTMQEALRLVQLIRNRLQALNVPLGAGQWSRWAFAATDYTSTDTQTQVLGRLEQGLLQAEGDGSDEVAYIEPLGAQALWSLENQRAWHGVLHQALVQPQRLTLAVQRWLHAAASGLQQRHEASLQLRDDEGQLLNASLFLPMARQMGLSASYDLRAVELGLKWLHQHPKAQGLIVRVSLASVEQPGFEAQLRAALRREPLVVERLVIEMDAHALVHHPDATLACCALLQQFRVGVGLRGLDQSLHALLHLPSLQLDYVKISGYFAEQALHNTGARHLLEAILQAAQTQPCAVLVMEPVSSEVGVWLRDQGACLLVGDVHDAQDV